MKGKISDARLSDLLELISRPRSNDEELSNPQRLIQVANLLRPLGKDQALNVMFCFGQLDLRRNDWLFWLTRVLFKPRVPSDSFAFPLIGVPVVYPPNDLGQFPTYPIKVLDDIPLNVWEGGSGGGHPEPFYYYVQRESPHWVLRSASLSPPDDPFPSYRAFLNSPEWKSIDDSKSAGWDRERGAANALRQILALVSTAYDPKEPQRNRRDLSDRDYDRYHEAFLKLHCRWDPKRQVYVRGDGSFTLPVAKLYPSKGYVFRGIPRLDIKVTWYREDDESVGFSAKTTESPGAPLPLAILRVVNERGQEYYQSLLNGGGEPLSNRTHMPSGQTSSSGWRCPEGTKVRFIVEFDNRTYESPLCTT